MRDMVDNARKIVLSVQIPVFADADTGYGDAIGTHYTVREYVQAGIAGAHIEDQTFTAEIRPPPPLYLDSGDGREAPGCDRCQTGSRPGLCDHGPMRSRRRAGRQLCGDY